MRLHRRIFLEGPLDAGCEEATLPVGKAKSLVNVDDT